MLVGYVVGNVDLAIARRELGERLPKGIVPLLITLDELPMGTSGKVSRKALPWPPPPQTTSADATTVGLDTTQAWLAERWAEQLGPLPMTAQSNFFELGGSSLAAAKLVSALRARFAAVAVADVYNYPKRRRGSPGWAGVPVIVLLIVSLAPTAVARLRVERTDLRHERGRSNEIGLLRTTITTLGGYTRIRECGEPVTVVEYASALAWLTRLDVGSVGFVPSKEIRRRRHPIVLFLPVLPGGWAVRRWHTLPHLRPLCASLHASYVLTKQHPTGELLHG